MALGAGIGDADADGHGLQRVRQRRLPRQPVPHRQDHRQQGAACWPTSPGAGARRVDARHRPRNAFIDDQPAGEVDAFLARRARPGTLKRPDIYGKTGTTNDSMDAWFAGYQRQLVAVVWMGYDTPRKLGDRETGGGLCAAGVDRTT